MWNLSAIGQISIDTSFSVRLWKFRLPRQWSNWLNPFTCGGRSINTTRRMLCRNLLTH
nr:MAG TPA: hypothetical protein [Caudoviricetes sp.]